MEQVITCINCPVGCRLTVTLEEGQVTGVTGNTCIRGEKYARQECVAPERMITAVVPVQGRGMPLSVKTQRPVPKRLIPDCLRALSGVTVCAPVRIGDVVLRDVCGTGVDIVATRDLD